MRRNPLIIGGGPAGCAAAITLARAGCIATVLERQEGPADKVCGDFLSADTIQRARALGVDPAALGAAPIRRVRLVHGNRTAETVLPFAASGLSRRVFDDALLRTARAAGADVRCGQAVRRLRCHGGDWTADGLATGTVFLATGKHDLRDVPRPRSEHDAVGLKMYFALPDGTRDDAIELTLFAGGYAGLQPVEDGKATLCVAVRRRTFQALGGNWQALLDAIAADSPHFRKRLANARELLPRPLAVAGIPYGYQATAIQGGLFRLGDQAAVIPSLTGDGMAIALHSGQTAAETWLAGGTAADYHQALTQTLMPQMRLAGLLHHAALRPTAQALGVGIAWMFPGLVRHAASRTRIRNAPPPAPSPPAGKSIPRSAP